MQGAKRVGAHYPFIICTPGDFEGLQSIKNSPSYPYKDACQESTSNEITMNAEPSLELLPNKEVKYNYCEVIENDGAIQNSEEGYNDEISKNSGYKKRQKCTRCGLSDHGHPNSSKCPTNKRKLKGLGPNDCKKLTKNIVEWGDWLVVRYRYVRRNNRRNMADLNRNCEEFRGVLASLSNMGRKLEYAVPWFENSTEED
jgi:hypothetical protein